MEISTNNNTVNVKATPKKKTVRTYLEEQGVPSALIDEVVRFRKSLPELSEELKRRIPIATTMYQGGAVWTAAISAILAGQHVLLEGAKATGKNVLASNLSFLFGRPQWDISFHTNTDASSLIGSETFRNGAVEFREGAVYQCALCGGFGVLDEINMAKNEALSVLHSITDDRRVIDVSGYNRIELDPSTRFIGTMNYGYSGTRELNEALVSRFVVINVPTLNQADLTKLLSTKFPDADNLILGFFAKTFTDIETKAENAQISSKCVDLRGIISAIKMIKLGMKPKEAMEVNVTNKAFEKYERDMVKDLIDVNISDTWCTDTLFPKSGTTTVNFDI